MKEVRNYTFSLSRSLVLGRRLAIICCCKNIVTESTLDFAYFLSCMALTADSDRTNSRGLPLFFTDFTNRFQCRQASRMTHSSVNVHEYEIADTSHIPASRNIAKVGVSSSS